VVSEHAGGYSDWLARGGRLAENGGEPGKAANAEVASSPVELVPQEAPGKKKKLSYKDQRELDKMPALLESLEQRQNDLEALMAAADFYQREHKEVQDVIEQLAAVNEEMEKAFERWAELEEVE